MDEFGKYESFLWVLVLIVGLMFTINVAQCIATEKLHKEAIEHDFARYNKTNGQWEWKTDE